MSEKITVGYTSKPGRGMYYVMLYLHSATPVNPSILQCTSITLLWLIPNETSGKKPLWLTETVLTSREKEVPHYKQHSLVLATVNECKVHHLTENGKITVL